MQIMNHEARAGDIGHPLSSLGVGSHPEENEVKMMAFMYPAHFLKLLFLLAFTCVLESVAHRGT